MTTPQEIREKRRTADEIDSLYKLVTRCKTLQQRLDGLWVCRTRSIRELDMKDDPLGQMLDRIMQNIVPPDLHGYTIPGLVTFVENEFAVSAIGDTADEAIDAWILKIKDRFNILQHLFTVKTDA